MVDRKEPEDCEICFCAWYTTLYMACGSSSIEDATSDEMYVEKKKQVEKNATTFESRP